MAVSSVKRVLSRVLSCARNASSVFCAAASGGQTAVGQCRLARSRSTCTGMSLRPEAQTSRENSTAHACAPSHRHGSKSSPSHIKRHASVTNHLPHAPGASVNLQCAALCLSRGTRPYTPRRWHSPTTSSWYAHRARHFSSTIRCSAVATLAAPVISSTATYSAYSTTQRAQMTWLGASCTACAIGKSTSRKYSPRCSLNSAALVWAQTGCATVWPNCALCAPSRDPPSSGAARGSFHAASAAACSFRNIARRAPEGPCAATSCRLTACASEPAYQFCCCLLSSRPHVVLGRASSHAARRSLWLYSAARTRTPSRSAAYVPVPHSSTQRPDPAPGSRSHSPAGSKHMPSARASPHAHVLRSRDTYRTSSARGAATCAPISRPFHCAGNVASRRGAAGRGCVSSHHTLSDGMYRCACVQYVGACSFAFSRMRSIARSMPCMYSAASAAVLCDGSNLVSASTEASVSPALSGMVKNAPSSERTQYVHSVALIFAGTSRAEYSRTGSSYANA